MWQRVPRFQRGALSPTGSRLVVLRASFDRVESLRKLDRLCPEYEPEDERERLIKYTNMEDLQKNRAVLFHRSEEKRWH